MCQMAAGLFFALAFILLSVNIKTISVPFFVLAVAFSAYGSSK